VTFVATAVVAGSALVGAGASMYAANKQADASKTALGFEEQQYDTTLANEAPFVQSGQQATGQLNYLLGIGTPNGGSTASSSAAGGYGSLNAPFTASTFQSMSPAYQFQLQQGAQGTLNQDSSAQGAESGAALKDLQSYNQNFANTSFNNAFNQYQTQQNNVFSRLSGLATLGQAAASNQATGASATGANVGATAGTIGGAEAAGTVGAANALGGGATNAAIWAAYGGGGSGISPSSTVTDTDINNLGNSNVAATAPDF
jgi:hypothetical protein